MTDKITLTEAADSNAADAESANKFFDGTTLEEEYAKRLEASAAK